MLSQTVEENLTVIIVLLIDYFLTTVFTRIVKLRFVTINIYLIKSDLLHFD